MSGHRLTGLPTPLNNSDAATKKWVTDDFPTKQNVLGGFTMTGSLSLGNNEIYGVNDPVTNKSAANNQYVDNKKAFFIDGSTTTESIDLRRVLNSTGFFCDVTFHSGAFCQDIDCSSSLNTILNKGSLVNGGLIGKNSFTPTLVTFLNSASSQKLNTNSEMFLIKATPSYHTILCTYSNIQGLTYRKVGNDDQLSISSKNSLEPGIYNYELFLSFSNRHGHYILLYGEYGAGGVNATTLYWPKSRTDKSATTLREQNNVKSAFFH